MAPLRRHFVPSLLSLALVVPLTGGCGKVVSVTPDAAEEPEEPDADTSDDPIAQEVGRITAGPIAKLDLLFVIDNSGTMLEEQNALAANFATLLSSLESNENLPDLHIGIVSTTVGLGISPVTFCQTEGGGELLTAPAVEGCPVPGPEPFIKNEVDQAGLRNLNYPAGQLSETFSCIARVGTTGCGFEQPFEAMKRALDGSNPGNAGFLREDAHLAVVIISDEDDCSASNPTLYSPAAEAILGPMNSYRCFEYGVVCAPDDPRTLGAKSDCVPRESSQYVRSVDSYSTFLRGLKADADKVHLVNISGPTGPVSVSLEPNTPGNLMLEPSCSNLESSAAPAIRLSALALSFGNHAYEHSICDDSYAPALEFVSESVRSAPLRMCLSGALHDAMPDTDGIQARCDVVAEVGAGIEAEIPACADGTTELCYRLAPSESCSTDTQMAVELENTTGLAGNTEIAVSCLVDP